jgi:hypothetical protein
VYPSFDLRRVNTLELAMLDALKYVIRVSASEYAKYYFHLRSMLARLGLNNQTGTNRSCHGIVLSKLATCRLCHYGKAKFIAVCLLARLVLS